MKTRKPLPTFESFQTLNEVYDNITAVASIKNKVKSASGGKWSNTAMAHAPTDKRVSDRIEYYAECLSQLIIINDAVIEAIKLLEPEFGKIKAKDIKPSFSQSIKNSKKGFLEYEIPNVMFKQKETLDAGGIIFSCFGNKIKAPISFKSKGGWKAEDGMSYGFLHPYSGDDAVYGVAKTFFELCENVADQITKQGYMRWASENPDKCIEEIGKKFDLAYTAKKLRVPPMEDFVGISGGVHNSSKGVTPVLSFEFEKNFYRNLISQVTSGFPDVVFGNDSSISVWCTKGTNYVTLGVSASADYHGLLSTYERIVGKYPWFKSSLELMG